MTIHVPMASSADESGATLTELVAMPTVLRPRARVSWSERGDTMTAPVEGATIIGSAPGAHVRVEDRTVSRLHAELALREDGVWVRDLGSKNGTFLGSVRVAGARWPEDTILHIGRTELFLELEARPREVPVWPHDYFGPLIGRSTAMRELFARLSRVASSDAAVLVEGETGTGKELVARAIHEASPRARQPYVIVDCAALPEHLLESELFGHARGAFTGAHAARAGAFEVAQGGTVFLDEIGELPLSVQPKLLRVLESKTVRRLGESTHRPVDVRFVCATHRDLRGMVAAGGFREDLYFRIAVLPIAVPALRERREDVTLLARLFHGDAPMAPELVRELGIRPWMGNVRELRNFVERARTLGTTAATSLDRGRTSRPPPAGTSPFAIDLEAPFKDLRERVLDHLEREYVRGLLVRCRGNITAVAQCAGLDRSYVHRLVRKHEL